MATVTVDGFEGEKKEEVQAIAQSVLENEEVVAHSAMQQALIEHYQNRVVTLGVQIEMVNRENMSLQNELNDLRAEVAGLKKSNPPAKKAASRRK